MNDLTSIAVFQELPAGDLAEIAKRCRWRRAEPDEEIVGYRDRSTDVFFVVEGEVRVTIFSISGKEVTFRDIGAGELFGEFAAIDGNPRTASVIALKKSLIATLPATQFWELLRRYPKLTERILKQLTALLRMYTERVLEFSTLTVRNRIHAELLRLSKDHMSGQNSAIIAPAPTHAEIASRISTHREAVTREISNLAGMGVVERGAGKLTVPDVARLQRMVDEVLGEDL